MVAAVGWAPAQTASVAALDHSETSPAPVALAKPAVYFVGDEMPTFPGGDGALLKFLNARINYPAAALDHNLSGKVHVAFTVDPQGHLHDPHVVRGLGPGLDEEALRLVRIMPWWNPGLVHGQPVWVSITMPIVFRAL